VAQFDLKKLTTLDRVVVGAGVIAIVALFLPWYGYSGLGYSASVGGFSAGFFGWFGAFLIIGAGVYLALVRSGTNMTAMKWPPGRVVFVLSVAGTVLVALRWITIPSGTFNYGPNSFHYGALYGMILTLILGIVQAICAFFLPGAHEHKAVA
jgi:hypothetical protein